MDSHIEDEIDFEDEDGSESKMVEPEVTQLSNQMDIIDPSSMLLMKPQSPNESNANMPDSQSVHQVSSL